MVKLVLRSVKNFCEKLSERVFDLNVLLMLIAESQSQKTNAKYLQFYGHRFDPYATSVLLLMFAAKQNEDSDSVHSSDLSFLSSSDNEEYQKVCV